MDIKKAKQEFTNYANNYDLKNVHITRKIGHSIRVMEISKEIAKSLNLNKEQIQLATLIGLLHDIARFEQRRQFGTYNDKLSFDHGDKGVEILKENNFIRKFIQSDKYDKTIYVAIKNHNKYQIEENLTEEELLFSKIIRDADKLDILYECVELFWKTEEEIIEMENSTITPNVYEQFKSNHQIKRQVNSTQCDRLVCYVSFIFDTNFKYNFNVLYKEKYIDKTINKFNFKDEQVIKQIKEIRDMANNYIETKVNEN